MSRISLERASFDHSVFLWTRALQLVSLLWPHDARHRCCLGEAWRPASALVWVVMRSDQIRLRICGVLDRGASTTHSRESRDGCGTSGQHESQVASRSLWTRDRGTSSTMITSRASPRLPRARPHFHQSCCRLSDWRRPFSDGERLCTASTRCTSPAARNQNPIYILETM